MPLFSRFKNRGTQPTLKGRHAGDHGNGGLAPPKAARWQSRWESPVIVPDEVEELVHVCTAEMKSRAEALDAPFLLLPFRLESDAQGARTFIRNFFKSNAERSDQYRGEGLKHQLRLTDSVVLCGILKWCWSRMPNGVVSWPVYDAFRIGEKESNMARNAFNTFIPIGSDSDARKSIICNFYDLIAAVAAHGKNNGLTGRKLSRLAGWWAFEHSDDGKGFEGGYKSWTTAADASSHLFFAYLRSMSPDMNPSMNVIERIPRALQALVASTEYPPETPSLLQRTTPRVVMLVDTVSPTPFALLRRAKHFEYRENDRVLREFSEFEDPIDALTDECKRVLYAISTTNQSSVARSRGGLGNTDESWTAFQSLGFSDLDDKSLGQKSSSNMNEPARTVGQGLRSVPQSRSADIGRPTTPSWADFLSSGFADDGSAKSPTLLYPPAHVLPPLTSRSLTTGPLPGDDENLSPGELAAITDVELDDAFWWVWMTSLASEEPNQRKAVFGRCALVETSILNGRWLIMEEQVKGASPDPTEGAYVAPKKNFFSSLTKRGRLGRKRSATRHSAMDAPGRALSATPSKTSITTDQQAKIKAAARALTHKEATPEPELARRGRHDEVHSATKSNSVLTIGLQSEAGPAMKWASSYDKHAIRTQYLGDSYAGTGISREELVRKASSNDLNGESVGPAATTSAAQETGPAEVSATEETPAMARPAPNVPVSEDPDDALEASIPTLDPEFVHHDSDAAPAPGMARPDTAKGTEQQIAGSATSSPVSKRSDRKPLPYAAESSPYRPQRMEEAASPISPSQNPAAAAAARAMQASSPETQRGNTKTKKQSGTAGGLKKFFGKKKDGSSGRDSFDVPRSGSQGLVPPADQGVSRRLSLMRKKPVNAAPPRAAEMTPAEYQNQNYGVHEPVMDTADIHHRSPANLSRTSTLDRAAAEQEFSRFDQGPMEDMPAVEPADTAEHTPEVDEHRFDTLAANNLTSQATGTGGVAHYQPEAPVADDRDSELTMEDHHDQDQGQDRWATIRDNAHRRAARERASEDLDAQSRPSQSMRTDDGETSGEETIESRVARIKARVAELTGNMDHNNARA